MAQYLYVHLSLNKNDPESNLTIDKNKVYIIDPSCKDPIGMVLSLGLGFSDHQLNAHIKSEMTSVDPNILSWYADEETIHIIKAE